MKILSGLAVAALVWFVALIAYSPNVDYREFETECESVAAAADGGGWLLEYNGGPIRTEVVDGESTVDELQDQAEESGITDHFFVQRQLDGDCTDRRAGVLLWSMVAGGLFVLCASSAVAVGTRRPREPAPA